MATEKKRVFKYTSRTEESKKKRQENTGYESKDSFIKEGFNSWFKPRDKENRIRIMPPTWDDSQHYGFDIYVHYNIGPKKAAYLCPKKMGTSDWCPVCDEVEILKKEGKIKEANALKWKYRVLLWVIDRKAINVDTKKNEGPKLWAMPWTIDRNIMLQAEDEDTGEVSDIDNPDDGYDIIFQKIGEKEKTKYEGEKVARTSTPLEKDEDLMSEWIDYIVENPIPDLLVYHDAEYIKNIFDANFTEKTEDTDVKEDDSEKMEDDEDSEKEEEEEGSFEYKIYEDVRKAEDSDLIVAILEATDDYSKKELKMMDNEALVSLACSVFDIEKPKKKETTTKSAAEKLKEKLANRNK